MAKRCLGSGLRVEADGAVHKHEGPQPVPVVRGRETSDQHGYLRGFRLRALAAGAMAGCAGILPRVGSAPAAC